MELWGCFKISDGIQLIYIFKEIRYNCLIRILNKKL